MLGAFLVVAQDLVSKESVGTPINEFVFGAVSSTPFSFFHVFLAMQHTCPGAVHWWFCKFLLCCVCCKCMSRARLAWKVIRKASNRRIENPEGCLCVWPRFFSLDSKAFLCRPKERVCVPGRSWRWWKHLLLKRPHHNDCRYESWCEAVCYVVLSIIWVWVALFSFIYNVW